MSKRNDPRRGRRDVLQKAEGVLDGRSDGTGTLGMSASSEATHRDHEDTSTERPLMIPGWPAPLSADALYGIVGDLVRMIEPHSEADPVAIATQFLIAVGNAIGRAPHYDVEADAHHMNTNLLLVGNTASGRKGVSLGHVRRVVSQADATWALRINSGLSSGEGLIWEVRDPIEKSEPVKEKGRIVSYQTVVADEGVTDKRLLVIQTEFARPLKAMQREGNTLSTVIREAWDSGNLNTMVKNSPARATNAHISVIGHVTAFELQQLLDRTDVANGFLNRFLVVVVRRSKCLPDGGSLEPEHFAPLVARVQAALEFGRGVGSMTRDPEARELWHREYPRLTADKPGAIGSVTSRAAPHVMRLACLYALLDRSSVVKRVHLAAALEINRYVEESVAYLFGGMLGDPTADAILAALREHSEGMTRTDIRDLFAGHRSKDEVDRALTALAGQGLATVTHIATGGRNKEIWTATKAMKASEAPSLPTAEGDTALLSLLSQPGKRIDI